MAVWLPLLKASLPYITQIVGAAIPAFTSRPDHGPADAVVHQQIAELQQAVTGNAEAVKSLAARLKETIEGIDAAAAALQGEVRVLRRLVYGAFGLAASALALAAWLLLR